MKILKLTIKKKWFDMIKSGEKKEEYREFKDYWRSRLLEKNGAFSIVKDYDYIQFFNGAYLSEKLPNFKIEYKTLRIGEGNEKWGAEKDKIYFCLELGKIL